jgi:anti-sigma B factor antagonist
MAERLERSNFASDLLVVRTKTGEDGVAVVALDGEVDLSNADEVERLLLHLIDDMGCRAVRCDLRELTYIDSCGVRALLLAAARIERDRGRFDVICTDGPVHRVLEISNAPHRVIAT